MQCELRPGRVVVVCLYGSLEERERERAREREREVVSIEMLTRPLDPAALWIFLT